MQRSPPGRYLRPVQVHSYRDADMPRAIREQVRALHEQAWPSVEAVDPDAPLHDPALAPVVFVLVLGERVVASLGVLTKTIEHEGELFSASGLSAVVTDRDQRGRGHGRALVKAVHEHLAGSGVDLGIFTCDRPLAPFYETAGWRVLPATVLVGGTPDEPFPSDSPGMDKVTLADFFTDHAMAHEASFIGARIGLYPGTIDRLW